MNKSEKFWDRVSRISDKPISKLEQAQIKSIENIKKYLNVNDIVFDYGCGAGAISNEISEKVKMIYAVDMSSGMIDVAKRKASELKIENINFAHSNLFDEKYTKESFNVILAFNILPYLDNKQKVMKRINEMLKPGGLFISSTACLGDKIRFLSILLSFLTKIGLVPKMSFFKISELENLITSGNFNIIKTENLSLLPDYFIVAKKI